MTPFEQGLFYGSLAILVHVAFYNFTARLEYSTRIFTRLWTKRYAIYVYAAILVFNALLRDYVVHVHVAATVDTFVLFHRSIADLLSRLFLTIGIALNLWTLQVLGIKGMYNGDSFGYLFVAPITSGPYQFLNDPQYVGTSLAMLGHAVQYQSHVGYALTIVMYVVFMISVRYFEGPHMARIYREAAEKRKAT